MRRLLPLTLFAALALAQSDTATLSGKVIDPEGSAIAGGKIVLRNLATPRNGRRLAIFRDCIASAC
jgi:hypothetical protein